MNRVIRVGLDEQYGGAGVLELVEAHQLGRLQQYSKGSVLYHQGDVAEHAFVLRSGKVKMFSISQDGKAHAYEILGTGSLVGVAELLLGGVHELAAEALVDTDAYVIPRADLERVLSKDALFRRTVIGEVARVVRLRTRQVRDLSFLDVRGRLRNCLARLAERHGVISAEGVAIDLGITHQVLAEMIRADRATVTSHLNELKADGLVWTRGRRLILASREHAAILDGLETAVVHCDAAEAMRRATEVVGQRLDVIKAIRALMRGMHQVDAGFATGELGIPEVLGAADTFLRALRIMERYLKTEGRKPETRGTIVIGTVHGDIHSIGKSILIALLSARGFSVIDLGVDVAAAEFIEAIRAHDPDILAMSALLKTSALEQGQIIQALEEEGLRGQVRIMVGGGGVTEDLARRFGADGYEVSAHRAAELATKLMDQQGR